MIIIKTNNQNLIIYYYKKKKMIFNEKKNSIWVELFMISYKLKRTSEKLIINIWKEKKKLKIMNNNYLKKENFYRIYGMSKMPLS